MAVRTCPHCGTELSALKAASFTNAVECPKCGALLEVAPGARTISSFAGLLAGAIVWKAVSGAMGNLGGGVAPTLFAFLAFGVVSPLVLMFTANFRNAPVEPAALEPHHGAPAHGGHGGGNDDAHGGHAAHH